MSSNKTLKTILTVVVSIIATIGVGLSVFIIWFIYVTEYQITDIASSNSPDNSYVLLWQNIGEADFPFGPNHVQLVLKDNSSTISKIEFEVLNDGKNLHEDNWSVSWSSSYVDATIYGEEQYDVTYRLNFNGETTSSSLETYFGSYVSYII